MQNVYNEPAASFVQSIWVHLFRKSGLLDKGTMYQLKNFIGRTSVPTSPDKNMKAAEDFLLVVLHAHVVAAAKTILSSASNIKSVVKLADEVVEKIIDLKVGERSDDANPHSGVKPIPDGVYVYACDLLTLALIWMGFHDATKEGDGYRDSVYWKLLLPVFKTLGRKNYCIEALNIQLQRYRLSERQAADVVWSRFVNAWSQEEEKHPLRLTLGTSKQMNEDIDSKPWVKCT